MSCGTPEGHPVVVNPGPILALAAIGHLDLLRSLYAKVYVPEAIPRGVLRGGASGAGVEAFARAAWVERRTVRSALHPLVVATLDEGERERHISAVRPLLDELRGHGIWLGRRVYEFALREAGKS